MKKFLSASHPLLLSCIVCLVLIIISQFLAYQRYEVSKQRDQEILYEGLSTVRDRFPEDDRRLTVGYAVNYPLTDVYLISILGFLLSIAVSLSIFFRVSSSARLEGVVKKRTHDLNERVKELSTIFSVNELLKRDTQSAEHVFDKIVEVLPGGWQYPELCRGCISFEGRQFQSKSFINCVDIQTAVFYLQDGTKGSIEIGYLEKMPAAEEGPFLKEERNLINVLAETIQVYFNKRISQDGLMLSEARFRSAFEDAAIGMAVTSLEGQWLTVNPALCDMLGYTADEMQQRHSYDMTHPDNLHDDRAAVKRLVSGEIKYYRTNKRYIHKNGAFVWTSINVALVKDENAFPLYFVAQITNITGHVESQLKFQNLVEKSLVGVYIIQNGRFVYVNPKIIEESGYSESELLQQSFTQFIYEEDLRIVRKHVQARLDGCENEARYEVRIKRKDGGTMWTEMFGSRTIFEGTPAIIGTIVDVTGRKNLENERQHIIRDLQQRNKDLEQFNYILSHNVRAPLATILGLTALIKEVTSEEERAFTAEGIENSAKQLDAVIDDLNEILNVRRGLAEDKCTVNFKEIVAEVKTMLGPQIKNKGAVIEYDFSEAAEVENVRSFVNSIYFNLISNSQKYSKEGVAPRVRIKSEKVNGRVLLTFNDNGLGIDMEKYGDRIFMLYKGFHPREDSRGLGLFMVKTQLESVNGHISVESKVGEGTTFLVSL